MMAYVCCMKSVASAGRTPRLEITSWLADDSSGGCCIYTSRLGDSKAKTSNQCAGMTSSQNGSLRMVRPMMAQGSQCKYPSKQAKTFITSYGPVSDVALYHPHCIYYWLKQAQVFKEYRGRDIDSISQSEENQVILRLF